MPYEHKDKNNALEDQCPHTNLSQVPTVTSQKDQSNNKN